MEVKLLALQAVEAGLTREEVSELVGVSPTTIGAWRKRYEEGGVEAFVRKPSTVAVRKRCAVLEARILARRQAEPDAGVRRIRDELRREEGLEVSAETVRQVVNEAGLGNPPPEPHRRPPQARRFERPVPNALWQIDIFTFSLKRLYQVYLVGIIDDHSRYIVGWGLYRRQTADAVLEVVKGAIGQWGAPREILSDNGRQFVAWHGKSRFQKVLLREGIDHSRSAPHHPMTLGKIERFWQTIWTEFLEEAVFASFADACQRLEHWVAFYNHRRPHQGIDGACPADRFYGLTNDIEQAVAQGCKENSLRLALGQEPQAPLFLLGQLGTKDVRVTRKGDEIELKIGDVVHEVIRLGAPYTIDENGQYLRGGEIHEVAGPECGPEVRDDRDGPVGEDDRGEAEREPRGEEADALQGYRGGGGGCEGGPGAREAGAEAEARAGSAGLGAARTEGAAREGSRPLEDEVRRGEDASGPREDAGAGGGPAGRKKTTEARTGGQPGTWSLGSGTLWSWWLGTATGADD
jgi:transposase InsO family protein